MRGAWIEMAGVLDALAEFASLPVRGAWIEIKNAAQTGKELMGRSPCGERGLKSLSMVLLTTQPMSLPVRGAWIEITLTGFTTVQHPVAPRAGSVD